MQHRNFILTKIDINASVEKVWRVFTDPAITNQMGGEYVTDWKVGSAFCWKGFNGQIMTNGILLELEPMKLLKHNLFHLQNNELLSTVTYEFEERNSITTISAKEELFYLMNFDKYNDAQQGWEIALQTVKGVAETSP
jgi:uncharacterized protein YndB with AHSA1/START domain